MGGEIRSYEGESCHLAGAVGRRQPCWGRGGRDSGCIMCMGMLLTRTHCYVAEFGLHFGPSASQEPASALTFPGSRPGAPPTGHRAQTP